MRKFEAVETAEGTRYLLDGEEIRHVVSCELEERDTDKGKYLLTLKVAVSNYSFRLTGTGERDRSYHQLLIKMDGTEAESVLLDEMNMMPGLIGFGIRLHYGKHGTVATLVMGVSADKETAKRYMKNEGTTAQNEVQKAE
jgi:hypothetical protein